MFGGQNEETEFQNNRLKRKEDAAPYFSFVKPRKENSFWQENVGWTDFFTYPQTLVHWLDL